MLFVLLEEMKTVVAGIITVMIATGCGKPSAPSAARSSTQSWYSITSPEAISASPSSFSNAQITLSLPPSVLDWRGPIGDLVVDPFMESSLRIERPEGADPGDARQPLTNQLLAAVDSVPQDRRRHAVVIVPYWSFVDGSVYTFRDGLVTNIEGHLRHHGFQGAIMTTNIQNWFVTPEAYKFMESLGFERFSLLSGIDEIVDMERILRQAGFTEITYIDSRWRKQIWTNDIPDDLRESHKLRNQLASKESRSG